MELSPVAVEAIVRRVLDEDLGGGDLTTWAVVPAGKRVVVAIGAEEAGVMCGHPVAEMVFRLLDPAVRYERVVPEGGDLVPGATAAVVSGPARAVLAGEDVALGLMQRMCGVATAARRLAGLAAGTRARVADTRKTLPGLRLLDKYAVRVGGGVNHRHGLDDGILIKDNHIALAGGVAAAVTAARRKAPSPSVRIEVEVEDLAQLQEAVAAGADVVLLDNMDAPTLREAVRVAGGRVLLEASGGITPERVAEIAATGVDFLSTGAVTHSAPALALRADLLRIE